MNLRPYKDVILISSFIVSFLLFIIPLHFLTMLTSDLVIFFGIEEKTFIHGFVKYLAPLIIVALVFQYFWIKLLERLDKWIDK